MHFILRHIDIFVISLEFLSFIFASIYGFFHAKKIHLSVGPFFEIFHIQPIFAKKGPNWEKLIIKMYDSQHIQLFCSAVSVCTSSCTNRSKSFGGSLRKKKESYQKKI